MNVKTAKEKLKEIPLWVKVAIVLAVLAVGGPLIMLILKGAVALVALAMFAFIVVAFGPWFLDWVNNMGHNAQVNEAIQSPIPTLERRYASMRETEIEREAQLKTIIGRFVSIKQKTEVYARKHPEDLDNQANAQRMVKYARSIEDKKRNFSAYRENVNEFELTVEKARDKWTLAMEMRDFDLATDFQNDPMELLKSRVALESVENMVNQSLATLDSSLMEDISVELRALEAPGSKPDVVDAVVVQPEKVRTR